MNNDRQAIVACCDTSAVLSSLFVDVHSHQAHYWANRDGFYFLSTLIYAETCAVVAGMQGERRMAEAAMEAFP